MADVESEPVGAAQLGDRRRRFAGQPVSLRQRGGDRYDELKFAALRRPARRRVQMLAGGRAAPAGVEAAQGDPGGDQASAGLRGTPPT
ncbi:hypothetical protein EAD89_12430 [Micromonospora sp. BL4]|uniref:hypothetical protein n=1 Tax=Micromonospora sp. BL4 TaxID=2478710 RepID=UPI000F2DCC53|nr:hypothetical protein [Micromonospora sp. BL4]RLP90876.1 hypothetical protein EAD89_12430 [Micromonospora sp. BL4]